MTFGNIVFQDTELAITLLAPADAQEKHEM